MKWDTYKTNFIKAAKANNKSIKYIEYCLKYALYLYENDLPIIYDQTHFSMLVGYDIEYISAASHKANLFYRTFNIPKKNGDLREISEPLPNLKDIQKWILEEILYKCKVSKYAKAYIPRRSVKENARFHRNQKIVLTLDIKNFFGSIKYIKIYLFFRQLGYSVSLSTMLANLCCLDGSLPQGAPTSPALSNLVTYRIDQRIGGFALNNNIRYTRYSDDMTFSGDFDEGRVIQFVSKVVSDEGLTLNDKKTRVRYASQRQEVTGITVNNKLQASKEMRRKLRQELYYINKYGLKSHLEMTNNSRSHYIYHLLGIAYFIIFINPQDSEANLAVEKLKMYLV